MTDVAGIDLFCGAGGVTYGLERAGIEVVAGVDIDPKCRYPYETNTDAVFLERDVMGVLGGCSSIETPGLTVEEIEKLLPDDCITVLTGCAPCQPFSVLNNGNPNSSHEKWGLLGAMQTIVDELRPDIVAMENVAPLRNDEIYSAGFQSWFENEPDYNVWDDVIDCKSYKVPQSRKRLIMLASRFGDLRLIPPNREDEVVTVRRAFADIDAPKLDHGEWKPEFHSLHKAGGFRSTNQRRIRKTAEGEDWHDLPDHLKPPSEANSSYSAYGRMWWDRPAPTLTTKFFNWGSGRFGHPGYDEDESKSIDRAISLLEGAILQTFPVDYEFVPDGERPVNDEMGRLIGNAVPVRIASVIGGSIRRHLEEYGIEAEFERKHITQGHPQNQYENLPPTPADEDLIEVSDTNPSDPASASPIGQPIS